MAIGAAPRAQQNKRKEIAFFDDHADEYDVFTPESNARIVATFVRLSGLAPGARVADLGCGSGAFSHLIERTGFNCIGLDLNAKLIGFGCRKHPQMDFLVGDVEQLPFPAASFDGVLLNFIMHHLPDPSRCAAEVFRILRPGGSFVALDPNRMNPFMWLYRDRSSPFYSSLGVTENERPILARQMASVFEKVGFRVCSYYLSGLKYRYVASSRARLLLPIYSLVDAAAFGFVLMRRLRPFVVTVGEKR